MPRKVHKKKKTGATVGNVIVSRRHTIRQKKRVARAAGKHYRGDIIHAAGKMMFVKNAKIYKQPPKRKVFKTRGKGGSLKGGSYFYLTPGNKRRYIKKPARAPSGPPGTPPIPTL